MMSARAELADLLTYAKAAGSYAYRFYVPGSFEDDEILHGSESGDLVELRVWPDATYRVTPVDSTGRPVAGEKPPPTTDEQAYQIGGGQGAFQPGVAPNRIGADWAEEN